MSNDITTKYAYVLPPQIDRKKLRELADLSSRVKHAPIEWLTENDAHVWAYNVWSHFDNNSVYVDSDGSLMFSPEDGRSSHTFRSLRACGHILGMMCSQPIELEFYVVDLWNKHHGEQKYRVPIVLNNWYSEVMKILEAECS